MRRWLLGGCAVLVALCAPLAAQTYTYTNGLGFGTDANGQAWNIWSANGSNIWDWQQNYVGGYLHYAFKIHNYTGFFCSGSCRYHNVWSKNPTLGFVASDVLGNDSGVFPESNQNNHKYQVDVQWNASGYHATVYDITAGSAYSAVDYPYSVNANTYDSWTWGYSLWTGHAYADENASTHASNWTSTIYQDGITGTIGGGGDIRTDALPVVLPALPTITTQPSNQTVTVGANTTFTLAASGTPTPTLQWQVSTNAGATWTNLTNGASYSGATSMALTVNAAQLVLNGTQYRAVATNGVGPPAISNTAALTVTAQNPTISAQPANQKVKAGQSAHFTVLASGTPAPTYRWERLPAGSSTWSSLANSGSYSGATTATLLVTGVTASMNGDQFRAVATNIANSVTSNAATLTSLPYAYTYTNGLGFGTDVNGNVWNIWSANGSNIWSWQQNYVGRYLHYAFKIYDYAGFFCSGSCRYHNVWDKNPTFGFEAWDVRNDSGIFPESNQNNHIYQVDVQWNAGGYHATVYDLTAGSAYSANDYAYPVDANTYDSWTWGTSFWTGQAYADENASTHASNWTSTIFGDGVTGTTGGGGDVRTDALPVVFPSTPILLPVSISTNGTVSFTCPTGYTVIGFESFKGTYPDTSTHVSTNTLGPTLVCSSVGAGYGTMENGYLNGLVPTGDGNYWVRISKEGTAYVNTDFSGEWYYWTAQRVAGVWSIGGGLSTGTISATTNLSAASFTITGPASYSGSGLSFTQANAPAGTYTITYGAIPCYGTPASQTFALTAAGTISFNGTYQGAATLSVNIGPAAATSATFSINPPVPGMPSNGPYPRVQNNVWPQLYTVTFNPVNGFQAPPAQTLGPSPACALSFAGTYTQQAATSTALISVQLNQPGGGFSVYTASTNALVGNGPASVQVPAPGTYVVKYNALQGYYTPLPQTVTLKPGDSAPLNGIYRRLVLVSFTGFNNAPNPSSCFSPSPSPGSGVQYFPDQWNQPGTGMTQLLLQVLNDPVYAALKPGAAMAAFTFYTTDGQGHYFGDACTPPSLPTDLIPISARGDHAQAGDWMASQVPTQYDIVAVVGHSYGGNRARFFVEQLKRANIATDLLVTVDPIDWGNGVTSDDGCRIGTSTLADLLVGCNQSAWRRGPSSATSVISYFQLSGVPVPLLGGNVLLEGYQMQNAKLTLDGGVSHLLIDEDPVVHATILTNLLNIVHARQAPVFPQVTALPSAPTRTGGNIVVPIKLVVTGTGTAMSSSVATASLNGVPSSSIPVVFGDVLAGTSSASMNLSFSGTAAASGTTVQLTVTGQFSYGQQFSNTFRMKVP